VCFLQACAVGDCIVGLSAVLPLLDRWARRMLLGPEPLLSASVGTSTPSTDVTAASSVSSASPAPMSVYPSGVQSNLTTAASGPPGLLAGTVRPTVPVAPDGPPGDELRLGGILTSLVYTASKFNSLRVLARLLSHPALMSHLSQPALYKDTGLYSRLPASGVTSDRISSALIPEEVC
jgi:hypothetical protein